MTRVTLNRRWLSKYQSTRTDTGNTTTISYGTAGFRAKADQLDHVMFRMGILAGLRSRVKLGAAIGVMITASHNPEDDNGVKLIDPLGEMLDAAWEPIATDIVNVDDANLESKIQEIVNKFQIDMTVQANVLVARDTRLSGQRLAQAAIDGIQTVEGSVKDFGLLTTPQLHYIVLCQNSNSEYGQPTEHGYYLKLSRAFRYLNSSSKPTGNYNPSVVVDGANGIGAVKLKLLMEQLGDCLSIELHNDGSGILNHECGADFVKVQQKPSPAMPFQTDKRYLAFDGDADRIIYYYKNPDDDKFHMLDGDKIAVLVAAFLKSLIADAQLQLDLLIVQTAYANGSSTSYIRDVLKVPVACVPTGVKHLHHRAQQSDVGVYFEANGHGTVVFSKKAKTMIKEACSKGNEAAPRLDHLIDLINETTGDAISDMLVVETILRCRGESAQDWDNLYEDLPNRQLKVNVKDRNVITTGDAERKCLTPESLQTAIDATVKKYPDKSRSFVRPSGTEDVVRVYAESTSQLLADQLAQEVARHVFDLAGGVGTRP